MRGRRSRTARQTCLISSSLEVEYWGRGYQAERDHHRGLGRSWPGIGSDPCPARVAIDGRRPAAGAARGPRCRARVRRPRDRRRRRRRRRTSRRAGPAGGLVRADRPDHQQRQRARRQPAATAARSRPANPGAGLAGQRPGTAGPSPGRVAPPRRARRDHQRLLRCGGRPLRRLGWLRRVQGCSGSSDADLGGGGAAAPLVRRRSRRHADRDAPGSLPGRGHQRPAGAGVDRANHRRAGHLRPAQRALPCRRAGRTRRAPPRRPRHDSSHGHSHNRLLGARRPRRARATGATRPAPGRRTAAGRHARRHHAHDVRPDRPPPAQGRRAGGQHLGHSARSVGRHPRRQPDRGAHRQPARRRQPGR